MTPSYFYVKKHFPNGLNIQSANELGSYRVCGLLGYSYTNFGIKAEKIDTGTKNFSQLVEKTNRKRCNVFLAHKESFVRFSFIDKNFIEEYGLAYQPIPNATQEKFYLLISRNYKDSLALKELIDKEIDVLESSGELSVMINNNIEKLKSQFTN